MAGQPKQRLGRPGQWILALSVGLLSFFVCEILARVRLGSTFVAGERLGTSWKVVARFDPVLGWANESGARGNIETAEFSYRASINSLGFRDPPQALAKREGVRRVLFLGDSMTWGWGVNDGERFCDLLGARLGAGIEVTDAAVPGYGTDQELWTLAACGDALSPDLVVLVFVLNDTLECRNARSYDMDKPRFVLERDTWSIEGLPVSDPRGALRRWLGPGLASMGAHSALWTSLLRWRQGRQPLLEIDSGPKPYLPKQAVKVREAAETLLDVKSPARHALTLMRAWCAERKIPFAVLVLPHKHDQYLYEPLHERPEFDGTTAVTKVVERVGTELDFPVLNVDALMFAAAVRGERLHCGDGHLNAAGNQLVAEALVSKVEGWLAGR